MSLYILDTNHFRAYQDARPQVIDLIRSIGIQQMALTVITVEEQSRGWLKAIKDASQSSLAKRADRLSWAYSGLRMSVKLMNEFEILEFSIAAYERFLALRRQGIRISTADLQIAAIAVEAGAIIVTQNRRDFEQVPGLLIEDWLG